jgi:hypothetical protein
MRIEANQRQSNWPISSRGGVLKQALGTKQLQAVGYAVLVCPQHGGSKVEWQRDSVYNP